MRPRSRRRGPVAVPRLLAPASIVLSLLAGCTAAASDPPGDGVVLVVLGDSLTAGTEELQGSQVTGEDSWVPAAVGAPIALGGGWAVPGATTADMRSGVRPLGGDVAVLMAGTNDIAHHVDWRESRDNLLAVSRTLRVSRVVLSAIPPYTKDPAASLAYNDQLRELAQEQEWTFADPWTGEGTDGVWIEGASADGIHPVQAVADEVGRRLRDTILEVAVE